MFLRSVRRQVHTLRFRLTLWYGVVFTAMMATAFAVAYRVLVDRMESNQDEDAIEGVRQFDLIYQTSGFKGLSKQFAKESHSLGSARVFCRMLDSSGFTLFSTDMSTWEDIPSIAPQDFQGTEPGQVVLMTLHLPTKRYPVRTAMLRDGNGNIFQYGISMSQILQTSQDFRELFLLTGIAMLLVAVSAGYFVTARAMKDLGRITDVVNDLMRGDFSRRVPELKAGDEVETLGKAFNLMAERVEALIHDLKEVTNNIAHDLRSPLTRIRAAAEMALTRADSDGTEHRETLGLVMEECDRLIGMINTMLEIAEADSRTVVYTAGTADLAAIARAAVDLFELVADDRQIKLTSTIPDHEVPVPGDVSRLQRVLANLIDNAIKFTPDQGRVDVTVRDKKDKIVLIVQDTGVGIPPDDIPRVFERFYRCDASRTMPGNGLGLSYVRSVVRAHGADVSLDSKVGQGTRMAVTFRKDSEEGQAGAPDNRRKRLDKFRKDSEEDEEGEATP